MEELKVTQESGIITTNLDAIEADIKTKMEEYKDYVVSEDSIKDDKKVLTELRKLRTSLDDARKATKKQWLEPYEQFEERCKKVIGLVDEKIKLINDQLKLFDEERIAKKKAHIMQLYIDNIGEYEKFLPIDKIYNDKWNNVSCDDKDIVDEIQTKVIKVKSDLTAISALNSEIEDECIATYMKFGNDLGMAIQRNSQYLADKAKIQQTKEIAANPKSELTTIPPEPVEVKVDRMVHFIVLEEDAPRVREMLEFSKITYSEE